MQRAIYAAQSIPGVTSSAIVWRDLLTNEVAVIAAKDRVFYISLNIASTTSALINAVVHGATGGTDGKIFRGYNPTATTLGHYWGNVIPMCNSQGINGAFQNVGADAVWFNAVGYIEVGPTP